MSIVKGSLQEELLFSAILFKRIIMSVSQSAIVKHDKPTCVTELRHYVVIHLIKKNFLPSPKVSEY